MKKPTFVNSLIQRPKNHLSICSAQIASVLLIPRGFACGLCAKQFEREQDAWGCVSSDALKLTDFPLVSLTTHQNCYYQCFLCARIFVNAQDAALCTSHHLPNISLPVELNSHLQHLIDNTLNGQRVSKRERFR
jgi:hypothetical protein